MMKEPAEDEVVQAGDEIETGVEGQAGAEAK
jgi:hypothetical protein